MLDPKQVTKIVSQYADYLKNNKDLIQIFEGDLYPYLDHALKSQLSLQSYLQAKHRVFPVNILPKVIDKLTNIYQTTIIRKVSDGTDADEKLLKWYEEKLNLNDVMHTANELFNLCRGALLYPINYKNKPCLRPIQNDRFIVVSQDPSEPLEPTDIIICAGQKNGKDIYWVFDEFSFVVYVDEKIDREEMAKIGNPEGINPYGRLPFVWGNDSKYNIMPVQDSSVLRVVITIPVIISDLNLAAMFQTFSILYGIDLDDEDLQYAPNAFWKFKTDLASDKKPEIGQIKPQVDIDQVIRLVEAELSMWLGTKGIRPGSVGKLSSENIASGLSKIVDEMDTFEARQKQVLAFQKIEEKFWDLLLNYMHPYWVATGTVENRTLLTPGAKIKTEFAIQLPQVSRGEVVRDLIDEISGGLITKRAAIEKLNPQMSSEDIEQLIKDIEEERNGATRPGSDNVNPGDTGGDKQNGPAGDSGQGNQPNPGADGSGD